MRFYAVSLMRSMSGNHGYQYFSNKADATKCKREWEGSTDAVSLPEDSRVALIDAIDIKPTEAGILDALNQIEGNKPKRVPGIDYSWYWKQRMEKRFGKRSE